MQAPLSWIKEYLDITETPQEIAQKFTMAGLEVSEISAERFGYENSYVGRIERVEQHPEKSDFWVLHVKGGEFENQVLTNYRKFEVGELLPIERTGFVFPDLTVLEPRKMGGVVSDGKIMAEADIEYSDNQEVILPLPEGAKPGDIIPDIMGITDTVLKFDLTANRGDCLSIFGLCRELSAILDRQLKKSPFDFTLETSPRDVDFTVKIKDKKLCPRYTGRIIKDIKIVQSPVWMKRRLTASGMRPINSIVDITNYVMLEVGQPLHAFDLDTLKNREIIVRRAKKDESIITIDGLDRKLTEDMLVIADSTHPVAVAGVMGGALTEIKDDTSHTLLESAHFAPRTIRRTSIALGLKSEAALRFEKGVDMARVPFCSDYAAYLIQKLGWGTVLDGMIDEYPLKQKTRTITVSYAKIRDFLGDPAIDNERITTILRGLNFVIIPGKSSFKADVPSHRFDISIWEDLAEEVARIYGYQNVCSELPRVRLHRAMEEPNFTFVRRMKDMLAASGLNEAVTFSFTNAQELEKSLMKDTAAVPLKNPLTEEHTHLRPSLIPAMLRTISANMRRGNKNLSFFELGKIFMPGAGEKAEPTEKLSLVMAVAGNPWRVPAKSSLDIRVEQYYQIKGAVEDFLSRACGEEPEFGKSTLPIFHPHHSASVYWGETKIGELGEVHPQLCRAFDIRSGVSIAELDPAAIRERMDAPIKYGKISRHPALARDLSIIVGEEVDAAQIRAKLTAHGGDTLKRVELVDVFRGEVIGAGKKSVTFNLEFRHPEKTLSDEEINGAIGAMLEDIKSSLGGTLREM